MDFRKVRAGNSIYEVVNPQNFNPETYSYGEVAIQHNGMVYPYENPKTYEGPVAQSIGNAVVMYDHGQYGRQINYDPTQYSASNIINFNDAKSMSEIINASKSIRKLEDEILVTVDNVYTPVVREGDTPEMSGLKQAIQAKQIDIDKYKPRFGDNYGNDRRLLEGPSITFPKLGKMMEIFDLKATLIIEDKSPDVPNPMNKKIVVELE